MLHMTRKGLQFWWRVLPAATGKRDIQFIALELIFAKCTLTSKHSVLNEAHFGCLFPNTFQIQILSCAVLTWLLLSLRTFPMLLPRKMK